MNRLFAATGAAMMAITVSAGVKYWDNPAYNAFDVGDYVQDGLVVNYDGIRNAGPNAAHDSTATTWVNCANPGTYDQTRYSLNVAPGVTNWVAGAAKGSWAADGFVFNTNALFHQGTSFNVPATYTMQTLVDAKASKQTSLQPGKSAGDSIGYVMCDRGASNWSKCSIGIRRDIYSYNGTKYQYSFYLVTASDGKARPAFGSGTDVTFNYATAMANGSSGSVFFNGTEAPWSASGSQNGRSTTAVSAVTFGSGFSIGGHYPNVKEYFSGTVKNFRIYNRCLNDAEVLWNRVVDEARYFGRGHEITVIPVTNVVESCTITGVRDYHYAIDAEGYTFTAPASKTVNGKRHVLSGYTLETWNGSAWGTPVAHNGEYSYTATDTAALVRITWQYTAAAGEGKLRLCGVGDYVQDGLLVYLDGLCNAGTNAARSATAATWINLGSNGSASDATLVSGVDASGWTDDGFYFDGYTKFTVPMGPSDSYTVQLVSDIDYSDFTTGQHNYFFSGAYNQFAGSVWGQGNVYLRAGVDLNFAPSVSKHIGYYTAIMSNGDARKAYVFEGTSYASGGTSTSESLTVPSFTSIVLGGWGGDTKQFFHGTIKAFRYYSRALTEEELCQNRRVDNYRYYGIYEPSVTNVVVCSAYSYLEGYDKCGAYEVDGSYTFVAPESVEHNGITYACDGYTIETMDANGNWGAAVAYSGTSYAATDSGTVRLTWRWKATHGLRSAADYDVTDYVAAGLKLHLDGICNAGVDKPRTTANTAGTKWVNLGSNGTGSNASLTKGSDNSAWTDDGYYFDGKSKFVIANVGMKTNSSYTIQLLSDVDRSLQRLDSSNKAQHNYLFSGIYNQLAVSVYGRGKPHLRCGADVNFALAEGEHLTYFTGIMDQSGASPVAYVFPGVTAASGTTSTSASLMTPTANNPNLGGWGGSDLTQYIIGTIKNFRYYDRVLTQEELVRNRNVDSARYFGALAVTNVVVESDGYVATPAPGAYFVEGSYTFTAATGAETSPVNAYIQDWDEASGRWVNGRWIEGGTYTHDVSRSAAKIRLTWRKGRTFKILIR